MIKAVISQFKGDNSGQTHIFADGHYINVNGADVSFTVLISATATTPNQVMESAVDQVIASAPTGFAIARHEVVLPNLVKG